MTSSLYLPTDALTGRAIDFDLAADFLELAAFFSADSTVATSDLANTASIAAAEDHIDLEDEIDNGEEEIFEPRTIESGIAVTHSEWVTPSPR